jgi:hypothetical protein
LCEVELEFSFAGPVGAVLGVLFGATTREYIAIEAESLKRLSESGQAAGGDMSFSLPLRAD